MQFRAANAYGTRIPRNIPVIWYGISTTFRLAGDILTHCPVDSLVFVIIIYTALRSIMGKFRLNSLFRVIMEDTTRYFLVVFASHLTLVLAITYLNVRMVSYVFVVAC